MSDIDEAAELLSAVAERIALDTGRSAVILVADEEGGVVGLCIHSTDVRGMVAQLRLIADDLAERAAAELN